MTDWTAVIKKIAPQAHPIIAAGLASSMTQLASSYFVNTPRRQAIFLGQAAHETDAFQTLEEYASGAAYEGRRDLGNIFPGDGRLFKGRGIFQVTGRENYRKIGAALGVDFVKHPALLATFPFAAQSAGIFWTAHGLNDLADRNDVNGITHRINGGFNGLSARRAYTMKACAVLGIHS